jgi:CheY-like chemotaxis protein
MRTLLTTWGCEVAAAATLQEASLALEAGTFRPEVIIADYHLDEGDGLDAIRALRQMTASDLPAVLITADRTPAVREAAAALDAHVLNKPVRPAALRALLAQWRASRVAAE